MAQGFVGTGGPGNLQVSGPGFSLGPGVNIGGQGYGGQIDQLMAAERDYMPKLQRWQQEQTQRAERGRQREMADLRRQMQHQASRRPGGGRSQAFGQAAANVGGGAKMHQFRTYGKYGGQSYWAPAARGRNDFTTGASMGVDDYAKLGMTGQASGPGASGASLRPMEEFTGSAAEAGQRFNPAMSDWQSINPGVRTRMLGAAYDAKYGAAGAKPTSNTNWTQSRY